MGGGVSAALLRAGGNAISLDAAKKVPASLGDVVVTTAGELPAEYIFHVITIGTQRNSVEAQEVVDQAVRRCIHLLATLNLKSIAFPAIGSGAAGFDYEYVAIKMADAISSELLSLANPLDVTIYLFDRYRSMQPIDFIKFFEEFAAQASKTIHLTPKEPLEALEKNTGQVEDLPAASPEQIKSRRIHSVWKLMSDLEAQRLNIEQQLVKALGSDFKKADVDSLREKLRENEDLRFGYQAEINKLTEAPANKVTAKQTVRTVFVSSTYTDLISYRAAVKDEIARLDLLFRGMEHFGADPHLKPAAKIVEEVRRADVYLGIFGHRYGFIDHATGLSMTELEFNEAKSSEKPMFLYLISDDAFVKGTDIEKDPIAKGKLDDLKKRMREDHTIYHFNNVDDLRNQVSKDLGKLLNVD
jgi:O-acetyl-ADP-ribose deacetylase (regulator of RNase III)